MTSKTTNKVSPEVRARAVRMVLDHEAEHPSRWQAIVSIAAKIGCEAGAVQLRRAQSVSTVKHVRVSGSADKDDLRRGSARVTVTVHRLKSLFRRVSVDLAGLTNIHAHRMIYDLSTYKILIEV